MNGRQKRSSGGYDLRRKVAKKRWDEDFEYYFSKIGVPLEPNVHGQDIEAGKAETQNEILLFDKSEKVCNTSGSRHNILQGKRSRGRPRKGEVVDLDVNVVESNATITESELQEEIVSSKDFTPRDVTNSDVCKDQVIIPLNVFEKFEEEHRGKHLELAEETVSCSKEFTPRGETNRDICKDQVIIPLNVFEKFEEEHGGKHLKLAAILSPDEIGCLQEEEVSSAPEMEKENLTSDTAHMESGHETLVVQMTGDTGDLEDIDEIEKGLVSQKVKRRYRRGQLNEETIQKLSQLGSDDKIECEECHKLLKPSSYRQHVRTHTGVKPFGCDMCDAKFTRKGDVERHVRIVHNKQKPYKCSKCNRCFGDKKNLRWHLMNHDKRLFYACEVCGFKFGKREYWENHVRIIHPNHANQKSEKCTPGINENVQLHALTGALLAESENSIDDPDEENLCVESTEDNSNQKRKLYVENHKTASVAKSKPTVGNEKKGTVLRKIAPKVISIPSVSDRCSFVPNAHTGGDVMGTVVIQLDGNGMSTESLESTNTIKPESVKIQNLFHINTSEVLELIQSDSTGQEEQYIVNEQCSDVSVADKLVVSIDEESVRIMEYPDDVNGDGSKVYGIMLTENLEKENNVQNFVEVLLAAVGKGSQKHSVVEAS